MTLKISNRAAIIRAMRLICDEYERGTVVSWSSHVEPTMVARISVCFAVGGEEVSSLPGLPGVSVETVSDTADTDPAD
jgi:hypothetical protein